MEEKTIVMRWRDNSFEWVFPPGTVTSDGVREMSKTAPIPMGLHLDVVPNPRSPALKITPSGVRQGGWKAQHRNDVEAFCSWVSKTFGMSVDWTHVRGKILALG